MKKSILKKRQIGGKIDKQSWVNPDAYINTTDKVTRSYDRSYHPNTIRQFVQNAAKKGMSGKDINDALSISMQETGLGQSGNGAYFDLNPGYYKGNVAGINGVESVKKQLGWARGLQNKRIIPEGEDYLYQGYNGYGKIGIGHPDLEGSTRMYGVDIPKKEGIDFKKNPLYGKRISYIRDNVIKSNPQIQNIVKENSYNWSGVPDNTPLATGGYQQGGRTPILLTHSGISGFNLPTQNQLNRIQTTNPNSPWAKLEEEPPVKLNLQPSKPDLLQGTTYTDNKEDENLLGYRAYVANDEWVKDNKGKFTGTYKDKETGRPYETYLLNTGEHTHNDIYPKTEYRGIETIPFKKGSYFTTVDDQQEQAGKRYWDKKTGRQLKQQGGILDPRGQWAHPGKVTIIPSNDITMEGVNYPVLGVSDTGHTQLMQPGGKYKFKGNSVTEYPQMQSGGRATEKDSLDVMNNAITLNNYYKNLGLYNEPRIDYIDNKDGDFWRATLGSTGSGEIKRLKSESAKTYNEMAQNLAFPPKADMDYDRYKQFYKWDKSKFKQALNNTIIQANSLSSDPNRTYYKDMFPSRIDINAPGALLDKRIAPQGTIEYKPKDDYVPGGSITGLYYYDPIAVKPARLKTKEDWDYVNKKYGIPKPIINKKVSPVMNGIDFVHYGVGKLDSTPILPTLQKYPEQSIDTSNLNNKQVSVYYGPGEGKYDSNNRRITKGYTMTDTGKKLDEFQFGGNTEPSKTVWHIIPQMQIAGEIKDPRQDKYYTPTSSDTQKLKDVANKEKGSKGTEYNPITKPEVAIVTRRTKPLGYSGQVGNAEKTNPALQVSSGEILKDLFVEPVTRTLGIPANAVAKTIQELRNVDWESKSGHKLDSINGIVKPTFIKDTTGFFENTPMNALGIKSDKDYGFDKHTGKWDSTSNSIGLKDLGILAGNVAADPLSYTPFMLAKLHREKALANLDNITFKNGPAIEEREGLNLIKFDPATGESTWAPKPEGSKTASVFNSDLHTTAVNDARKYATETVGRDYMNLKYGRENLMQSKGSIEWSKKYDDIFKQYSVNSNDFKILVEDPKKYSRFISTPTGAAFVNALINKQQVESNTTPAMQNLVNSTKPVNELKQFSEIKRIPQKEFKLNPKAPDLLQGKEIQPTLDKYPEIKGNPFAKTYFRKHRSQEIGDDYYKYNRLNPQLQKKNGGKTKWEIID